jgi:hypothetical protein
MHKALWPPGWSSRQVSMDRINRTGDCFSGDDPGSIKFNILSIVFKKMYDIVYTVYRRLPAFSWTIGSQKE